MVVVLPGAGAGVKDDEFEEEDDISCISRSSSAIVSVEAVVEFVVEFDVEGVHSM